MNLDLTVAWWVSGADLEELEREVRKALALPEKPVIAYLDRGAADAWPAQRPSWVTDRVWPAPQAYRDPGEPLQTFKARIESTLERVKGYGSYIALTPAFYTRNGAATVAEILESMPLYERWIRDYPIVAVMPFADRRPTGMLEHPEFRVWAKAFLEANPARPNRFDYWQPDSLDLKTVLGNKLGQSTETIALSAREKKFLLEGIACQEKCSAGPPPPPPPPPGLMAPDRVDVVTAVRAEHPEIDPCDESSLDRGRALLVDWAAQRLNAQEGRVVWGRKSRGNRPTARRSIQTPTG